MKKSDNKIYIEGPSGKLEIKSEDKLSLKLGMIFEVKCLGKKTSEAPKKYGYTKQRFYQILKAFEEKGSDGLIDKKTGPKSKKTLTESTVNQIIRYRFLYPDSKTDVIVQKLKQEGVKISKRSVERVITKYGLQKKTL